MDKYLNIQELQEITETKLKRLCSNILIIRITFGHAGDIKNIFRPMADILGDFFTKPLQGSLFV